MILFTLRIYISCLYKNYSLIRLFVGKDIRGRFIGTIFGPIWVLVFPILLLVVYTIVFGFIFQTKLQISETIELSMITYGMWLFIGIFIHLAAAETLTRAPTIFFEYSYLIKRTVFPSELIPIFNLCSSMVNSVIAVVALSIFSLIYSASFPWGVIYLPLILIPYFIILLSLSTLLSYINIFFRDLRHLIPLINTVLLFVSPIFYPMSLVPEDIATWLYLNPLTVVIEYSRSAFLFNESPFSALFFIYWLLSFFLLGTVLEATKKMKVLLPEQL